MTKITKLYLVEAKYAVATSLGEQLELHVDYRGNKYMTSIMNELVSKAATRMLANKHGVNFAYKFDDIIVEEV